MDFSRLQILSREIDFMNAIILKQKGVSFESFFEGDDIAEDLKVDKICEICYKVINLLEDKDDTLYLKEILINHFGNENAAIFIINFILLNIEDKNINNIGDKLDILLALPYDFMPMCQMKIDYLNLTLSLLLKQEPLDMELINSFNDNTKSLILKYDK